MDQTTENRFPRVILASASPRRLDLLRQVGIEPEIEPSHVEEVITSTVPDQVVMELSRQKAEDIAALHTGEDAVAVSYTHLDVYKRQPLPSPTPLPSFCSPAWQRIRLRAAQKVFPEVFPWR